MDSTTLHDCIYCRRRLPKKDFNREHVLSTAFGTFKNAPVLHQCVCGECNQFFGNELEVRFARGAFEGMLRYQRGTKTPAQRLVNLRYVELTIPNGTPWGGVRLGLLRAESGLQVELLPQVAFLDVAGQRWVHLTAEELDNGVLSKTAGLDTSTARFFAPSAEARDALVVRLAAAGITFKKLEDLQPPAHLFDGRDMIVEVTFTVNKGIRRCIAKYAFNYLTFSCGQDFVRAADFDPIRRFIRYGDQPAWPLVVERFTPVLRDDRPNVRQTEGHLLTINWAASGTDVVGQVSLFNYLTYSVSLARRYTGLWRPIRSGLHFNQGTRTVQPLTAISNRLLP